MVSANSLARLRRKWRRKAHEPGAANELQVESEPGPTNELKGQSEPGYVNELMGQSEP